MWKILKAWLRKKPKESDLFGVNVRETFQALVPHKCNWEHRTDKGEEEHGVNFAKRYCKICGKCQHGWYHRYGNIRVTWEDSITSKDIKLP